MAITIPYDEFDGSPEEGYDEQGNFTATRRLRCAWADRLTLARQLKGGVAWNGGAATYEAAHAYPHLPAARCATVAIANHDDAPTAFGGDPAVAAYDEAILTVVYRTNRVEIGDGGGGGGNGGVVLIEESVEPYAEFLTLPAAGFKWGSTTGDPLKDDEAPGKLFKGAAWNYTRHFLFAIPPAVFTLMGKVNAAAVTSNTLGIAFAAETLLYNPPVLSRVFTTDGVGAWTLAYRFGIKPQGWNRFWRAKTGAWARIFTAAGPADPYETGDFTALVG